MPLRVRQNRIYFVFYRICHHWLFTTFITFMIIANTIVLAMDKYPEDPNFNKISDQLNDIFTWAFFLEMCIKLIGIGVREYCRDKFNIFDALIVILSFVDMIITATSENSRTSSSLSAMRGFRLLRVFKLARSWTSFREILAKIFITMKDVSYFSLLLLMFMLIFTLLGMELFGSKVKFENDRYVDPASGKGLSPRPNFDNI